MSSNANDIPTILSVIGFRPVVSVSMANILSICPKNCFNASIVVIVSHENSCCFVALLGADVGISHAFPGNSNV